MVGLNPHDAPTTIAGVLLPPTQAAWFQQLHGTAQQLATQKRKERVG